MFHISSCSFPPVSIITGTYTPHMMHLPQRKALVCMFFCLMASYAHGAKMVIEFKNTGDETVWFCTAERKNYGWGGARNWVVDGWYELRPGQYKKAIVIEGHSKVSFGFVKRGGYVRYTFNDSGVRKGPIDGWHVDPKNAFNYKFAEESKPRGDIDEYIRASMGHWIESGSGDNSLHSRFVKIPSLKTDQVIPYSSTVKEEQENGEAAREPEKERKEELIIPDELANQYANPSGDQGQQTTTAAEAETEGFMGKLSSAYKLLGWLIPLGLYSIGLISMSNHGKHLFVSKWLSRLIFFPASILSAGFWIGHAFIQGGIIQAKEATPIGMVLALVVYYLLAFVIFIIGLFKPVFMGCSKRSHVALNFCLTTAICVLGGITLNFVFKAMLS